MNIVVVDNGTTAKFVAGMRANGKMTLQAMTEAATETAKETQEKCRADIASAGRFGPRWTDALTSKPVAAPHGVDVVTTFQGELWRTFQTGKVVHGKPLLWLPLSFSDAAKTRVKDYPGELVRVDRAGGKAPLLVSTSDHQPKYFGKESVTIPKKFHLIEIAQQVGRGLADRYIKNFARLHGR